MTKESYHNFFCLLFHTISWAKVYERRSTFEWELLLNLWIRGLYCGIAYTNNHNPHPNIWALSVHEEYFFGKSIFSHSKSEQFWKQNTTSFIFLLYVISIPTWSWNWLGIGWIYGAKYSIIILVPFQGQLVNKSSTLIMIFSFDSTLASKLKVWGYTIL